MTLPPPAERPPRILVADDDPAMRILVSEVLQRKGLEVRAEPDGLAALTAFTDMKPDLVMLDVHMPGLDGYQTCVQLRQSGVGEEFPIILMTTGDDEESVRRAFAAGATYFLSKPMSWTLLPHRVRYFLRAARAVRRQRELLHRSQVLFESSAEGILLVDAANHYCVDANPAFCEMLGYERDELRRLQWCDLQPPEVRPASEQQFRQCAATQRGRLEGILMQRKDGALFHADITHNCIVIDERPCVAGFFVNVTEKRLADDALMRRASHDVLTGLPNRALLLERLAQAVKQAQRRDAKVGLLFIDLDRFKEVNDRHGHATGDLLLHEVAARLQQEVRGEDTVARLGGDEFVVLMPVLESEGISSSQLAARLVSVLGEPFPVKGLTLQVGASIGIAEYPDDADDATALLECADQAMYAAKHGGRGQARRFSRP